MAVSEQQPAQRPAAGPRRRGVGAGRDAGVAERDLDRGRAAPARGLLPPVARPDLRDDPRDVRRGRGRRLDHRHQRPAGHRGLLDEVGGKAGVNTLAATVPAVGQRPPLRRDRPRDQHLPRPDPGGHRDRRAGLRAGWAIRGRRSTGPSRSCSRSPTSASPATSSSIDDLLQALVRAASPSCTELRPRHHRRAPAASATSTSITAGLPALEPGDPGRPPGHGQDVAGAQHRRACGHPRADCRSRSSRSRCRATRSRPAAHVRRGQGRLQPAPHRQAGAGRVAAADRRLQPALDRADLRRRHRRRHRRSRSRPRPGG